MTTYVAAREAIVAHLHPAWVAAYPNVKILYENTVSVDLDSAGDSFLAVSIDFQDSMRLDIDASPMSKTWGVVTLRHFSKDGVGTKETLKRFDWLTALMKYKSLSGVTLDCPRPGKKSSRDGWSSFDLVVPFWFWS